MPALRITNEFTGRETSVNVSRRLTPRRVRAIRARLIATGCCSGDTLGGRGRQDNPEAYETFLHRADQVVGCGSE